MGYPNAATIYIQEGLLLTFIGLFVCWDLSIELDHIFKKDRWHNMYTFAEQKKKNVYFLNYVPIRDIYKFNKSIELMYSDI